MINRLKGWISSRYVARLLLYFAVIGLVPILVFGMMTRNITFNSVQQQLALQTQNTVLNVSSAFGKTLDNYSITMRKLAENPVVMEFVSAGQDDEAPSATQTTEALMHLYAEMSGKTRELAAHVVSTRHNGYISTSTVPANYLPPFNTGWGLFRLAEASESAVLRTNDHNPHALSDVAFSMACAIRDETDAVVGYVILDVYDYMLQTLLSNADLSYDLDIYIVDNHHFMIYHTTSGELRKLPQEMYAVMDQENQGNRVQMEESQEAMYAATPLADYNVWILGDMSMEPANQANQYVRTAVLLAAAVAIVLCVAAAALAWRDLSHPIHRMIKIFKKMENGDLSARVQMGDRIDEFGVLGNRFDQMADEIEALIKNVEEKQRRLRISESSALQAQINPHFLYNTLDLIKWNAKLGNTAEVTKITVLLGKLLRSMANFEEDTVTVEEECNLIDRYLDIQTIHYGERLVIHRNIPEQVKQLRIPKLILQPVVENSIVHGFDKRLGICELRISASYEAPYLTFLIEDNGPGIEPELLQTLLTRRSSSGGIGLQNVHKRSHLHGDETCGLQISSTLGVGTTVRLILRTLDEHGKMLEVGETHV